jgi:hypothetical protein
MRRRQMVRCGFVGFGRFAVWHKVRRRRRGFLRHHLYRGNDPRAPGHDLAREFPQRDRDGVPESDVQVAPHWGVGADG